MVKAAVIIVGTEITQGISADSNSRELAAHLSSGGFDCGLIMQLPDRLDSIAEAINVVSEQFQLLILTGGLGSTHDDITREAIAKATGRKLIEDPDLFNRISRDAPSGADIAMFLRQAQLPEGSEPILAGRGTAPGLLLDLDNITIVALPGVPAEMRSMLPAVFSKLEKRYPDRKMLKQRIIKIYGPGEPQAAKIIDPVIGAYRDVEFTILASPEEIKLILSVRGDGDEELMSQLAAAEKDVYDSIGDAIFGQADMTLEKAVGALLEQRGLTLSVAESCTGGLLAEKLTRVPGSSKYFLGGIVSYNDEAKISVLGVARETLSAKGAVSEETALEMATGALNATGSDIALAVTGIAGPDGGTIDKPVGLVYIAIAGANFKIVRKYMLSGDRSSIRIKSTQSALDLLRLWLTDRLIGDGTD